MNQNTIKHSILLGYLVMVWGAAFALIAISLESFHPSFIVWCRLWMGAVVLLSICCWQRKSWLMNRKLWPKIVLLSLTGNVIPFSLIAWAEQTVPSAEVGILMAMMPIFTLCLAHWFLENEPMSLARVLGVFMGLIGVLLLAGEDLLNLEMTGQLPGKIATLMATLSYAFNLVYAKRIPAADPMTLSVGTLLVGSFLLLLPAFAFQYSADSHAITLQSVLGLVLLGVLSTGIATWVYFVLVRERGPSFLSTINYLIPAVAFLVGALLMSEPLGYAHLTALILILAGVWLIQAIPKV